MSSNSLIGLSLLVQNISLPIEFILGGFIKYGVGFCYTFILSPLTLCHVSLCLERGVTAYRKGSVSRGHVSFS